MFNAWMWYDCMIWFVSELRLDEVETSLWLELCIVIDDWSARSTVHHMKNGRLDRIKLSLSSLHLSIWCTVDLHGHTSRRVVAITTTESSLTRTKHWGHDYTTERKRKNQTNQHQTWQIIHNHVCLVFLSMRCNLKTIAGSLFCPWPYMQIF